MRRDAALALTPVLPAVWLGWISIRSLPRADEHQSLVHRRPSKHDCRSNVITLTVAGRRLTDRLLAAHHASETRILEPLTVGQRQALAHLLEALALSLDHAIHTCAPDQALR